MSFRMINSAVSLLATAVSVGIGVCYLIEQQDPFVAAASIVIASATAVALNAISCAARFTPRVTCQIAANILAVQMASIAMIASEDSELVYDSLLISTIFSVFSICAGFMCRDRVQHGNVNFV